MIAALVCFVPLAVLLYASAVIERRRWWREYMDRLLADMTVQMRATARIIGEELIPALEKCTESIRGFGEAFARAYREAQR